MTLNRIIIILIYVSIYLMLATPILNLEQNMLSLGPIHVFIFEIPLVFSYIFSITFILLIGLRHISKISCKVYLLCIIIAFIGLIGASMYATVAIQTILKDFRPILYWLVGIILVFIGHKHLQLKTLVWVMAIGLLTQLMTGILMLIMDPSLLYLYYFRLPGRSGWLTLFFVSLFFLTITHKKKLLKIRRYNIMSISIILIMLLAQVLLCQSRTTWIALSIMVTWWIFFRSTITNKLKLFFILLVLTSIIWFVLQSVPYHDEIKSYLHARFFKKTLSKEGIKNTWEGSRKVIYKSNLDDFQKRPFFGHGFGHQMYYDFTRYGIKKEDKIVSGTDNSFMRVLIKTGIVGLVIFIIFIYRIYHIMKKRLYKIYFFEEWIYLKSMVLAFPYFILISFNISILYGYPEVMIFSLFFSKASLIPLKSQTLTR